MRIWVLAAVSSLLESGGPSEVTHSSLARAAGVLTRTQAAVLTGTGQEERVTNVASAALPTGR